MRRHLKKSSPDTNQEPIINLTPLIDVVFVILISFIVIAPLLEMDKVQLARGAPFHTPVHCQDSSPIQIHVYPDNTVSFNLRKISMNDLPKLLSEAKRQNPTARPQLFHDKKACFGTYQQIKNILEGCGFSELDVVLAPK